jgi:hypothetical protein
VIEELGRRKVNHGDVYVIRFYNRLDESRKGEVSYNSIFAIVLSCGKCALVDLKLACCFVYLNIWMNQTVNV